MITVTYEDVNDSPMTFTPTSLREQAELLDKVRTDLLCNIDDAGADPFAEQHYIMSLEYLNLAVRALKLASLHQSSALGGKR
jgi:hypothetical protein